MTQKELYSYIDKMGSTLQAATYKDFMRFYIKIRPMYILNSIEIFKQIIKTYNWSECEFEAERNIVLNELYEKEDYIKIDKIKDSIVWKNHPLSLFILGTPDSLNNITIEKLIDYKKGQFTKENMLVVITGDFDIIQQEKTADILGSIHLNTSPVKNTSLCKKQFVRNPDIKLYNFNWDFAEICLSFDIPYQYRLSSELFFLNSIIGGGDGALLQKNIREKDSLTANIYSEIEYHKDSSVFNIYCTVQSKNIMCILFKIVSLLNSVKKEVTNEDYETNIKFFTDNLWFLLDDIQELNYQIGFDILFRNKNSFSLEEKINENKKINLNNIIEMSKNIFTQNNASLVIIGKTKMLRHFKIKEILSDL